MKISSYVASILLGMVLNTQSFAQASTSTEWRDDEANIKTVRELNRAYARLPFSRECEGVLDERPFQFDWTTGPNLPVSWKGGVAGLVGNEVILAGGLWMPKYQYLAYSYNIQTKTYTPIQPPPFKTEYTQGACDGTNVYVIGGRVAGRNVAKVSKGTDGQWRWSALPSLPEAEGKGRWVATADVVPGKWLFILAGHPTGTQSEVRQKPALEDWRLRLDKADAQWERMAPYPGGTRALIPSGVVDGKLYVFGGSHPDPVMREIFLKLVKEYGLFIVPYAGVPEYRDSYCYDPAKDEWKPIRPLPMPMHGGSTIVLQDRYIVLMGTSENKSKRVGKSDVSGLRNMASKDNPAAPYVEPYWTGYNDLILCYDTKKDNYSRLGVMLYGVATCGWVTDGKTIYGFGGEPYHRFSDNTETVLQIATIQTSNVEP